MANEIHIDIYHMNPRNLLKEIAELQKKEWDANFLRSVVENKIKEFLDTYGWPKKSIFDRNDIESFWLLVQHADLNPVVQNEALRMLSDALREGEGEKYHFAYLTDRVLINSHKPQKFGTQCYLLDGKMQPYPIEDTTNLEILREEYNLPPMDVYLESLNKANGLT